MDSNRDRWNPAPQILTELREVRAERDGLLREVARLTFITEQLRDLAVDWHRDANVLRARVAVVDKAEGQTLARCASQVLQVEQAAGEAEYRLHPARMAGVHLAALGKLLAALARSEATRD